MKNFNRGGAGGDRKFGGDFKKKSFGDRGDRGRGGFGGDRGDRPEMFKAICAECGASCEVPFKPNGNKPVLCSNCFKGSDRGDRRDGGRREERRFSDKPMFKAVCDTCGNECEVPFRPSSDKPIYCSNCFKQGDSHDSSRHEAPRKVDNKLEERLEAINNKLDKILKHLNPVTESTVSRIVKDIENIEPLKEMKKDVKIVKKDVKKVVKDVKTAVKKVIKKTGKK